MGIPWCPHFFQHTAILGFTSSASILATALGMVSSKASGVPEDHGPSVADDGRKGMKELEAIRFLECKPHLNLENGNYHLFMW